jgi:AcrR family transcriptional regulator
MVSAQRRAREIANLRRAILDAARELFAIEDYRAVSLRKIAEKVEYSPAAIYRYFSDKEEILFHLIDEGFQMLYERMHALDSIADPVERMRQCGHVYVEFALTQPHYYRLMFQLEKTGIMEKYMPECTSASSAFGFVRQTVGEAMASGQFVQVRPEVVVACEIWATMHGAVSLALSGHLHVMMPDELKETFFGHMIETAIQVNLVRP